MALWRRARHLIGAVGPGGIEIRRLDTLQPIYTPQYIRQLYGIVTAIHWVDRGKPGLAFLIFGTASGFICVWGLAPDVCPPILCAPLILTAIKQHVVYHLHRSQANGGEVLSIASRLERASRALIVVGSMDHTVTRIDVTESRVSEVFAVRLSNAIPRCVAFVDNSPDIHIFSSSDGLM